MTERATKPSMEGTAIYRISVSGRVDPRADRRLGGMNITYDARANGAIETVLVGRLGGQAALRRVLNELYEMHCPLLAVACLDGK